MNATPWDRAHAKSCWARRSVATDVVTAMWPEPTGVFSVEGLPRAYSPSDKRDDFMNRFREVLRRRADAKR